LVNTMTKTCTVCRKAKSVVEFYKNRKSKDGLLSHCIPCNKEKDKSPACRYSRFRCQCRSYDIELTISLEQYVELIGRGCHYCGEPLLDTTGASLDRIDRLGGYTPGNVLPCCWLCNSSRGVIFNVREMEELGPIYNRFRNERVKRGEPILEGPQKWTKPEDRKRKYGRLIEREQGET
jgi:hypothetical protein